MATLDAIKQRINSITTTAKITKAMELVATAKIKKARETFEKTSKYYNIVLNNVNDIAKETEGVVSKYLQEVEGKTIWIVLSSDLGLCGGYNINNIRTLRNNFKSGDVVLAIGQKAFMLSKSNKLEVVKEYTKIISSFSYDNAADIVADALELFNNKEKSFTKINLVAAKFINNATFNSEVVNLLPIKISEQEEAKEASIKQFEQSPTKIIKALVPMYIGYTLYAKMQEAKLIEQLSRRLAMESSTKNANEIIDDLKIQFNQKRQANITQEISEIIAGANA